MANSIEQLVRIKKKEGYNRLFIEDAYELVRPLILVREKRLDELKTGDTLGSLIGLIYDKKGKIITKHEELGRIKKRLSDVAVTGMLLEDILKGRDISDANLDIAIKTFEYLSNKCLEYCVPRTPCF